MITGTMTTSVRRPHIDDGLVTAHDHTIVIFANTLRGEVELSINEEMASIRPDEAVLLATWLLARAEECRR